MKHNKYASSTRRRTPWEDKEDLSFLESFIKEEYHQHYKNHHQEIPEHEIKLLNSVEITECSIVDQKR